jgi:hypothetical protein
MPGEHKQNAAESATPESLERARSADRASAERLQDDAPGRSERIDGGADTGPGTMPEGATPKTPRTSGDPLADAHGPRRNG